jgi:hypothetical protein
MATFIPLTHLVDGKPARLYVNVDQIVRIGDCVGGAPGYRANIALTQGQVDVCETAKEVMHLIDPPTAAAE